MFTYIVSIIIGIAVLVLIYFVGSAISLWIQALVTIGMNFSFPMVIGAQIRSGLFKNYDYIMSGV